MWAENLDTITTACYRHDYYIFLCFYYFNIKLVTILQQDVTILCNFICYDKKMASLKHKATKNCYWSKKDLK